MSDAMIESYYSIKEKHPDAILLFRSGEFYECLEDDAVVASRVLGLTLNSIGTSGIQLCYFPNHALDTYLPRLIRAGKRIAICDSLERQS